MVAYGPARSHQVHIVTVGDNRYMVDVGFGPNYCPIQPLRLIHDTAGCENIAPSFVRLVWKSIEGSANPYQKLWHYQHRINSDRDFEDMYCFTETEFLHRDFEVMNYFTSSNPRSFFPRRIICGKMISGGERGEDIVGVLILQEDLKRRIGAEPKEVEALKSERERVKALQDHFGITLNSIEQDAIKGTVAEIV
jgi:arylamine N-acetyltransferase